MSSERAHEGLPPHCERGKNEAELAEGIALIAKATIEKRQQRGVSAAYSGLIGQVALSPSETIIKEEK